VTDDRPRLDHIPLLIAAGGSSRRLRQLTQNKLLMRMGSGPLLGYILNAAADVGIRRVYVAIDQHDPQVADLIRSWRRRIPGIQIVTESPSGTAHAVRRLWRTAGRPRHSIVAAGDLVCEAGDLSQLHDAWCERPQGAILGTGPRRLPEDKSIGVGRDGIVKVLGADNDSDLVSLGLRIQDRSYMEIYCRTSHSRDTTVMSDILAESPDLLSSINLPQVIDVNTLTAARIGRNLAKTIGYHP